MPKTSPFRDIRKVWKGPVALRDGPLRERVPQMALTSRGMPGPNVVDTAPFWM
jgi:hypothetical protein